MSDNSPNQSNKLTIKEQIENQFKCRECSSLSQPIANTYYETPSDYNLMDIYVCVYCETGFTIKITKDGRGERQELSRKLIKEWSPIPF